MSRRPRDKLPKMLDPNCKLQPHQVGGGEPVPWALETVHSAAGAESGSWGNHHQHSDSSVSCHLFSHRNGVLQMVPQDRCDKFP